MKRLKDGSRMAKILSVVVLIVGVLFLGTAHATSLTIDNPSFESPAQGQGSYGTIVADWTLTVAGAAGVWYPVPGQYFTGAAPDGNQILYLNEGSVSQTLSSVLTAGAYTLAVDVGHRLDGDFGSPTISLLAGGNTLVSGGSSFDPGSGNFGNFVLNYTATAGSPYLGEPLAITISWGGGQSDLDNVRLDGPASAPVPLPSAFLLLSPGLVGLAAIRRRFRK